LETAFAQIAADALEVSMDRIRGVFHGSTSYVSDGYGAFHSRSVVMGGSAMLAAAENLRAEIRAAAAARLDCEPGQIEIVDGRTAVGPDGKSLDLASLAGASLSAEGAFLNTKHTYTYGALAAYLIPTASDFPNIRAVVLQDHPSPINPLGAKGAGEGGIIAVGGVIANAVANALGSLGVEPRQLPLTPSYIWELVQESVIRNQGSGIENPRNRADP